VTAAITIDLYAAIYGFVDEMIACVITRSVRKTFGPDAAVVVMRQEDLA